MQFSQSQISVNIQPESLTFTNTGNSTIRIFYQDVAQDNTDMNVTIMRLDTNELVYSSSTFLNLSEWTLYFDYSTLNVTANTLFKITVTSTDPAGTSDFNRYFTTSGSSGIWTPSFAFMMSFLLAVFGLSFTITRTAFSWFGIAVMLVSLIFASLGAGTWYIVLLQVIEAILLMWIGVLMYNQNTPEVA